MKRHEITAEELDAWLAEQWVRFASSGSIDSNKRLEVSFDGLYRVTDHGVVTYIGGGKDTAIRMYNEAR